MRKLFPLFLLISMLQYKTYAQNKPEYKIAFGFGLEVGNYYYHNDITDHYPSFKGITSKFLINKHSAIQLQILGANRYSLIDLDYLYQGKISKVSGLKWYVGIGPEYVSIPSTASGDFSFTLPDVDLNFKVGLDYKIPGIPFNIYSDWKAAELLTNQFFPDRFNFGLRFAW
jgi:hypothetical protein